MPTFQLTFRRLYTALSKDYAECRGGKELVLGQISMKCHFHIKKINNNSITSNIQSTFHFLLVSMLCTIEGGNRTGSILKAGLHLGPDCGLGTISPVSMEMTYQLENQAPIA